MKSFARSLNRGLHFGAQLGMVAAIVGMVAAASPVGFAIAPNLLGIGGASSFIGGLIEVFGGIVVGAAVGGATFATGNLASQAFPSAAQAAGSAPPRPDRQRNEGRMLTRGRGQAQDLRFDETDDRNVGFRRMIEEQRIAQEAMQGVELN